MSEREAHPVADLFPMLAPDELDELAADIRERGLLHPIVLDAQGRVLDGRNRLAACEMAGVDPSFVDYDGDDPEGYALAVNIARRHLSKGQKALVMARAGYKNYTEAQVSKQYVSWARTADEHAPDLADRVLDGTLPLREAYESALERKREADDARAKLDRLRTAASDLTALVEEERMALDDAIAALDARERKAREEAEAKANEQERARQQYERERQESLERDRDRVRSVTTGWPTVRDILADPSGEHPKEIIEGLGGPDREALERIIGQWNGATR